MLVKTCFNFFLNSFHVQENKVRLMLTVLFLWLTARILFSDSYNIFADIFKMTLLYAITQLVLLLPCLGKWLTASLLTQLKCMAVARCTPNAWGFARWCWKRFWYMKFQVNFTTVNLVLDIASQLVKIFTTDLYAWAAYYFHPVMTILMFWN